MRDITYIFETFAEEYNHGGSKARPDVNEIFKQVLGKSHYGYRRRRKYKNLFGKICYISNIRHWKMIRKLYLLSSKRIFMQYPFAVNKIVKMALKRVMKKNQVVLLVHDLEWLRPYKSNKSEEFEILNNCQACIVHNKYMAKYLKDNGIRVPMIELNCFDYLRQSEKHQMRKLSNEIAFAGNLNKSKFIKDFGLLRNVFFLYGPSDKALEIGTNVVYEGAYTPDIVPEKLRGSFGLIWDGDAIDTCTGLFGEYTKYNNPHKLSLYIAACLPVIVWSESAIAEFVKNEKIGFCVNSLYDIHDEISRMTIDDYSVYVDNISKLQNKVINGYFTKSAMKKAVEFFSGE